MGMFISFRYSRSMRINVFGVSNIKGFIVLDFLSNSDQMSNYRLPIPWPPSDH